MQFFTILSLAASALAYQVTFPTENAKWTSIGPNKFTWDRVETDALNFTLLLTNEDKSLMPLGDSQLAALIDGKLGTLSVNPPSTNFPVGKGYRLNLVKSSTELNSILAQSPKFEIAAAVVSSSAAGISGQNTLAGTNTAAAGNAAGNTANNVPASATVGTTAGLVGTTSPLNPQATTGAALSSNARFSAAALAVVGAIAFTL